MATFRTSKCQDGDEVLKCHEWRCQGIKRRFRNTRKSTSRRILTDILSKNSELKPNLSSKRSREYRSSRSIRDTREITERIISLAFCPNPNNFPRLNSENYKDLDKTRVKLFPNFTRHHLITHTYPCCKYSPFVSSMLGLSRLCSATFGFWSNFLRFL